MANKKVDEHTPSEKSEKNEKKSHILPIDKKQVRDLKTRAKALIDTFTGLGNALKKATTAHDEFVALLPPHLEGITHALQSIEEAQHKKRKRAEKDPDAPKKPATSYFLFSNAIRPKVKEEHPEMDQQTLATLMGTKWKALTAEERKVWEDKAQLAKEKYAEEERAYKASKVSQGKKPASEESSSEDDVDDESEEEEKSPSKKARKEAPPPPAKHSKTESPKKTVDNKKKAAPTPEKKKEAAKGKEKATPSPTKKESKKADEKKKSKK